jgi:WD40 repeat protein
VTVPTRDELARAVSQPAADVGLDLEPGLTAEIVADVDDQPGGLPLLQYALTELFRARTSNRLTGVDYRRIGGVTGALGTRAEGLYVDLGPDRQEAVRQVFLRLVTAGNGADDVRRRVRLSELSALALEPGALDVVLERFGSHRLLSFDRDPVTRGPTVEVAHEALLREWDRLHDWVESRRADLIVHRRFAAAVGEWEQAARDPSFLAQGGRLEQFETGTADSELTLTEPERAFLDASRERRAAEQRAAEERARRQVRTNRRLRRLLAGIGVLSVLVAIAGGVAVLQARRAGTAAVAADARRVGAQALAAGDMDRALLLAVEGVRLDDTPAARADLLTTLGRNPALRRVLRRDPDRAYGAVNVSADGRTGAVHDDTGRLRFFDTRSGDVRATYETGGVERASSGLVTGRALFHPDGGPIAVGTSTPGPQPVRLLDPDTFAELPDNLGGFAPQNMRPWGMAYSPDGSRLAVAFDRYVATSRPRPTADDAVVVLWDLVTPTEPIAILTDVPRHTHDVAFSPDGRQLYTAAHAAPPVFDTDAMIVVHDIATEAVVRTLDVPSHPFALHPDGTVLAAASRAPETVDPSTGTDVVLIDAVSGEQLHRLRGHTGPVTDLAFSPDGALVASSAADHTVAMWDVSTGDRVERLEGHTGPVSSVVFGPGDGAALSASVDGAVLAWDRAGDRGFMTARTIAGDLLEPGGGLFLEDFSAVSPSGGSILTIATVRDVQERGQRDLFVGRVGRTQAQLVDVASGRAGRVVDTGHGAFATAAWHPDGQEFVTVGEDGSVKVWDAATMSVIVERQMPNGMIGATYVDDGGQLLAVGLNGVPIQRLDAATLEPRSEPFAFLTGLTAFPYAAPDSDVGAIVTGDDTGVVAGDQRALDGRLLLVDTANGEIQHDLPMAFAARHAAMSPDGSVVAVAGDSGQVGVVDVADGRLVRPPTPAHLRAVVSVDYSPDGATVASGGRDGRVALWDGRTGDLRGTVQVTSAGTRVFVGFAPDGNTVTAATQDGRIHTIDVRPDRWVEHACAVAGRNLTRTEWRDAFGDRPYRETCERL